MFDIVQKRKRVVQVILAILVLPFALWGVESYRTSGADASVATVNGEKITAQQFDRSLRERQNELRRLVGGQVDQALLESPEVRNAVLEALVEQALLVGAAREMRMAVTDAELAAVIREVEAFQKDGSFNKQRYEFALRNQGMTPAMFEARVRQDMAAQRVGETFLRDSFAGKARTENLARLLEEQREVSVARIKAEDYRDTVKVDDAEVGAYYESHRADYQEPEQVKVRYAVFSADSLAPRMAVSDKEVKEYFDGHTAEFGKPEEREASHILITAPSDAPTAERALARKKADEILKEVRAAPDKFAELAKKYSQDPGSAAEGGSLGYFRRGAMVKAFEDATFALKQGEVSDVVESDFGFHIIKLTGIKPAEGASLDEARAGIETRLKQQKAQRQFAEIAEQFSNRAYEQSDSLKPAAEAAGVEVKESEWIPRSGAGAPFPANPRLMEAIFSEEVLKGARNTEAVEVAPNVLVAARLVEHRPARPKPLDEVKVGIAKRLRDEKAAKLAAEDGAKLLEKLSKGEAAELKWEPAITITRQDSKGLLPLAMREAYRVDPLKLPGYAGVEAAPGNYVLVRVNKVSAADQVPPQRKAAYAQRLQEVLAQAELAAFRAALRKSAEITVNRNAIAKPQ